VVDKEQDKYELKVDSKYGKYMKLLIAALTALGLIGTGAHQAGFFDIEAEPTSVNCAHELLYRFEVCHLVVNGLITTLSILNARFANCLP
jgi:hypothetical protein